MSFALDLPDYSAMKLAINTSIDISPAMMMTGMSRVVMNAAGQPAFVHGLFEVVSDSYPLYWLPYESRKCFRLYYSQEETNHQNQRYLMFGSAFEPGCVGHVSLYEASWNAERRVHVTLLDKDLTMINTVLKSAL